MRQVTKSCRCRFQIGTLWQSLGTIKSCTCTLSLLLVWSWELLCTKMSGICPGSVTKLSQVTNKHRFSQKNVAKRSHLGTVFGGFWGEAPHSKNLLKQMREHHFLGVWDLLKTYQKSSLKKVPLRSRQKYRKVIENDLLADPVWQLSTFVEEVETGAQT